MGACVSLLLVCQSQFVHRLQDDLERGFLILENQHRQALQHDRNIIQKHLE